MEWISILVFAIISLFTLQFKKMKHSERKTIQLKLISYLFLVGFQLIAIHYKCYYLVAIVIICFSLYELLKLKISLKIILTSLLLFGLFIYFSVLGSNLSKLFILVILFDGYSQLFGKAFGEHKIAPTVSPNKTWEGFLLGLTIIVLHSIIFYEEQPIYGLFLGVLIGLLAFTGDLLASAVKRKYHIKDFSNILVSHGGFLDRFDSLILTFAFMSVLEILIKISYVEIMINFTLCFLMVFIVAEYFFHTLKFKVESSRKFVHIASGFITLTFPIFIDHLWVVVVLCLSFILLLFISKKMNLLPSIHAIERKSYGSIYYPISVILCFYCYQILDDFTFYAIPLLILTISDSLAALVGKRFPNHKLMNTDKTIFGTLTFFISCFIILFFMFPVSLLTILSIAVIITLTEFFSKKGLDNLLIVCVTLILMGLNSTSNF